MDSVGFKAARRFLPELMERVCEDHSPVAIRRKGKNAVVLMPYAEYEALQETAHLLQSPHNARRLLESMDSLGGGARR